MESSLNAVGIANDQIRERLNFRERLNWGLIFVLLGCAAFWAGVVFGIVAAV